MMDNFDINTWQEDWKKFQEVEKKRMMTAELLKQVCVELKEQLMRRNADVNRIMAKYPTGWEVNKAWVNVIMNNGGGVHREVGY